MKSSEILEKAAEYIGEHGWCQGVMNDGAGGVCAMGAIKAVAVQDDDSFQKYCRAENWLYQAMLYQAMLHAGLQRPDSIPSYNDHPSTTAEDVILTFKRAAEAAREHGE